MKKSKYYIFILFLCVTLVSPVNVFSASLIHKLDFESDGWQDSFRAGAWDGKVARVSVKPRGGSYSLRGNFMEARGNDPITGLPGENNLQLEYVGNGISAQTPSEIFIRYWRKLDHSTWDGPISNRRKSEFITDDVTGTSAYYTRLALTERDLKIYGNGAYPQSENSADWGALYARLSGVDPGGTDGLWHQFAFYIDYRDPTNKYMKMWVDGVLLTAVDESVGYVVDGRVKLNDSFHARGIQFFYIDNGEVSESTDGDGYAAGWQLDDIEVWDGLPPDVAHPNDSTQAPFLNFTSPTTESTYITESSSNLPQEITIEGTADDGNTLQSVAYSTDNGQSGTVTTADNYDNWSVPITVNKGETVVATITAIDDAGKTTSKTMTIICNSPTSWSATTQTGDSSWDNSSVTYCVRLLVEGTSVTESASEIVLGFQGRTSGDYTIRKVSIAERDTDAAEGDVVDSTWKEVVFDSDSWTSNITVPVNTEKFSDPLTFNLQAGKDYYVTFKIDSPSVYLTPPSGYNELYFSAADHTDDVDWSTNGHLTTQDFHALSKIYVYSVESLAVRPDVPREFNISPNSPSN